MPTKYADLEIGLSRRDDAAYSVSFRLTRPEVDDTLFRRAELPQATLNPSDFTDALADPKEYGKRLTECFFSVPEISKWYTELTSTALTQADIGLRVRLNIGIDVPELHRLHWELLCEPGTNFPIATSQNTLFSRYLTSSDVRPSLLKSRDEMKALVVIANPLDLGTGKLPALIDAAGELARARQGFKDIHVDEFPKTSSSERATLNNIIKELSGDDYSILYLVCHGSFGASSEPMLFLEDEEGKTKRTSGRDFAVRLKELVHRPKLIVLASCESAGTETGNALSAFGPILVEDSGVPAVLAMQGKISMKTIEQFMPDFFGELRKHGYIDQALAFARGMVRGNDDFWMPVLFMRLVSGRLWYVPGYTAGFNLWDTLKIQMEDEEQTIIIGPGVFQPLLGSMPDIAESWAQKFNYPLSAFERDSLAKVAQFLYGITNKRTVAKTLEISLCEDIRRDFKRTLDSLPENLRVPEDASANALISAIGKARRMANLYDTYNILARLPVKIYITTNFNNLLTEALIDAGRKPRVMICPWNDYTVKLYLQESEEFRGFEPSKDEPLVFHMFGRLGGPKNWESVVLTEDDYFNFLLGYSRHASQLMPKVVKAALSTSAWLFVGFQMEDWGFRVLFRSILSQEGIGVSDNIKHVAAQFVPEEGRVTDSDGAQRYLEKYFGKPEAPINLYWGSAEEFLKELAKHMKLNLM